MAVPFTLKIKNLPKLQARLRNFPTISGRHVANMQNLIVAAVEQEVFPITPKKSGDLRRRWSRDHVLSTPSTLRAVVRNRTPYALKVHDLYEKGQSYKNPTTPGTFPRFLELAQDRAQSQVNRIADRAETKIVEDLGD